MEAEVRIGADDTLYVAFAYPVHWPVCAPRLRSIEEFLGSMTKLDAAARLSTVG
jgi:hypothetical protein